MIAPPISNYSIIIFFQLTIIIIQQSIYLIINFNLLII